MLPTISSIWVIKLHIVGHRYSIELNVNLSNKENNSSKSLNIIKLITLCLSINNYNLEINKKTKEKILVIKNSIF